MTCGSRHREGVIDVIFDFVVVSNWTGTFGVL